MEIRLARDEEGIEIKNLFKNADELPDSDWKLVYPYWAVAVVDDEIVAALQLCMSLPIGRLEHLLIKKDTNALTSKKAAYGLIKYGETAMKLNGCSVISGYVTFRNKSIKRLIKKHFNAQVVDSGSMLIWRLNS